MRKKIIVSFIILLISFIILIVSVVLKDNKFIAPEFDKHAQDGIPNVDDESYTSFKQSDNYIIDICGNPKITDNKLYLYLTSNKDNNINLKVRIYKGEDMIGESGLLKPNQYLEYVNVKSLNEKDKIIVKIMGYDKDYHSAGVIKLNLKVK